MTDHASWLRNYLLTHAADLGGWFSVDYPTTFDDGADTMATLVEEGRFARSRLDGREVWRLTEPGAAIAAELGGRS